jgi:hypothetical protein
LSSPPELAEGPLPPPRDRGAVERQLVAKKLLAAKQLIIGVLEPARAQDLVGEIVHRLQDREPCHQPRGQRRMPAPVAISGAELVLQKAPIDQPPELRQRVVHVHDLIEPRREHVVLPASPLVPRTHDPPPNQLAWGMESRFHARRNRKFFAVHRRKRAEN